MNTDKIITNIPWSNVMGLIAKLIRFSKGGIDKAEAAILAEDLLLLSAELIELKKK